MAHVKIRNRNTGGVWLCPAEAVEDWLAMPGWTKAAESAETTDEQPVAAATTPKEK